MSIRSWCDALADRVGALPSATGYADPARREHYVRTAEFFERTLPQERALIESAFLHGLWDVSQLGSLGGAVHPDVRQILMDRKRLRAIAPPDEATPQHLITEVLPSQGQVRSSLLLVAEQVLHLDPDERFAAFTEAFHRCPALPPDKNPLPPLGFEQQSAQLDFLRLVVVPTATFFGLWFYRNLAEDLCLYYSDEERFGEICGFALQAAEGGEPERRTAVIQAALTGLPGVEAFWEWHHVASLDRRLRKSTPHGIVGQLSRCGMVTILCDTPEDCYRAVARLHLSKAFQHQTRDLEDSIGNPAASGYEAFHTLVKPPGDGVPSIRARITHRRAHEPTLRHVSARTLEWMQNQLTASAEHKHHMRVFANDGRCVPLKPGSTVLNFAYAIHNAFVALAVRAFVNGDAADLLHPLKAGDVVRLELGTEPRELPVDWERKVPEETIVSIRKAHKRQYRPSHVTSGRSYVRKTLASLGVADVLGNHPYDDDTIDGFLEEAIASCVNGTDQPNPVLSVPWWLRQFAQQEKRRAEVPPPAPPAIDATLTQIADSVATWMKSSSVMEVEGLTVPSHIRGTFDRWVLCDECAPILGQSVVGRVEGRTLKIHVEGRPCGAGCEPVEWTRRSTSGQYFVVEIVNRQGIAAVMLSAFAAHGVHIHDLVIAALGPSWGVLRVHVRPLGPQAIARLEREVAQIDGVLRVIPPNQPSVPALEGTLPPRESSRPLYLANSLPFVCGPVVTDDRYFYGRNSELGELRELFHQTQSPEACHGTMAWVKGPFRTGKTSLVVRFLREVRRAEHRTAIVSVTAAITEGWSELERRLHASVAAMMRDAGASQPGGDESTAHLGEMIAQFRSTTNRSLVLVIDEAISMFQRTQDELPLLDFFSWAANAPGVFIIWIGPEAPVMWLPDTVRAALGGAHPVDVRGLEPIDIKYLLRATKLKERGLTIHVDDQVARKVFGLTRGNPYWCNLLATELFRDRNHVEGQCYFGMPGFKRACDRFLEQRIPFEDRIEDFRHGEFTGIVPLVLGSLVEADRSGTRGLTFDELSRLITTAHPQLTPERVDLVLEVLRSRGSIRRTDSRRQTWVIDSPALLQHIAKSYLDVWKRQRYVRH